MVLGSAGWRPHAHHAKVLIAGPVVAHPLRRHEHCCVLCERPAAVAARPAPDAARCARAHAAFVAHCGAPRLPLGVVPVRRAAYAATVWAGQRAVIGAAAPIPRVARRAVTAGLVGLAGARRYRRLTHRTEGRREPRTPRARPRRGSSARAEHCEVAVRWCCPTDSSSPRVQPKAFRNFETTKSY